MAASKQTNARTARRYPLYLGELVAIFTDGDQNTGQADSRPLLVAVWSDQGESQLVPIEQLGEFLAAHGETRFTCHDAAMLHWRLYEALMQRGDKGGAKQLWRLSEECRLDDIMLLEQRLELVQRGVFSPPKELGPLAQDAAYRNTRGDGSDNRRWIKELESRLRSPAAEGDSRQRNESIFGLAEAVFSIQQVLMSRVTEIVEKLGFSQAAAEKYGPLGVGIDVQGAIAARQASRLGLALSRDQAESLQTSADQRYKDCSAVLRSDPHAYACFAWEPSGIVKRDPGGFPKFKSHLRSWLRYWHEQLRDGAGVPLMPPLLGSGELSSVPGHWGCWILHSEKLRAWGELVQAAETIRALQSATESRSYHANYDKAPQAVSRQSPFNFLRSLFPSVFRPREGRAFLVLKTPDLELRCFVAGLSNNCSIGLLQKLQDGKDVVGIIAEALRDDGSLDDSPRGGQGGTGSKEFRRSREVAEVVLNSLTAGLPPSITAAILNLGDCSKVKASEVREWQARVLEVFPELAELSAEQWISEVAERAGLSKNEFVTRVFPTLDSQAFSQLLSRSLDGGTPRFDFWRSLQKQLKETSEEEVAAVLAEVVALHRSRLFEWPITMAGSVGRAVYAPQITSQTCLQLASEIRKAIAYSLVRQGLQLVAIAGSEVVLEVPENSNLPATQSLAEGIATEAAHPFLGSLLEKCCTCSKELSW